MGVENYTVAELNMSHIDVSWLLRNRNIRKAIFLHVQYCIPSKGRRRKEGGGKDEEGRRSDEKGRRSKRKEEAEKSVIYVFRPLY